MPALIRSFLRATLLAALVFVATGCATKHTFKVDAISQPQLPQGVESYAIVSGDPAVKEGDLQFKEAAAYLKRGLAGQGLFEAPNPAEADMVIELAFGVGPPETEFRTYSEPVIAEVGGGVRYETRVVTRPDGTTTTVVVPIYTPPTRQVVGSVDRQQAVTVHEKYLRVTAVAPGAEGSGDGQPEQLWSVVVRNRDGSDDLRKYLPLLTAAAVPHFGSDTEGQKDVVIGEDDPNVAFVRQKP